MAEEPDQCNTWRIWKLSLSEQVVPILVNRKSASFPSWKYFFFFFFFFFFFGTSTECLPTNTKYVNALLLDAQSFKVHEKWGKKQAYKKSCDTITKDYVSATISTRMFKQWQRNGGRDVIITSQNQPGLPDFYHAHWKTWYKATKSSAEWWKH